MMDYTMNGRSPIRCGNADTIMAPHNVYRCKGEDKWVSIAVGSDEEWKALKNAMGEPEWAENPAYANAYGRHENRRIIDEHMADWTMGYTHYEIMERLQAVGVAAMPSFCATEILNDPHVKARELLTTVEHPLLGEQHVFNPPWKLSDTPATIRKPGPCLGEDNEEVYTTLVGLSQQEMQQLTQDQVLY
jgi:benzylsuccinate CoA-transferase BbsF subunit